MIYDREEIENFVLGDLWAGMADPILKPGTNDEVFWSHLLQKCPGFSKHLDCHANRNTALVLYCQKFPGSPIICSEMNTLIRKLISIAYEGFTDPNAKPAEPVDTRPRDALGRIMSAKAIRFRDWTTWVNDPETSMKQVHELRRTNPEFAEFYATMSQRERLENPLAQYNSLNVNRDPDKVPEEVQLWAQHYRTRSIEEIRRVMSPAMVGTKVAAENQRMFDAATAAGLI